MLKFMHFLLISGLILSAGYVYKIKYESTADAERIQQVKVAIQKERDAIATLKAQWARLNRPERLQDLAGRHLGLQPMAIEQLIKVGDLPPKPERRDDIGALIEAMDNQSDALTTGTIRKPNFLAPLPLARPMGGPRP